MRGIIKTIKRFKRKSYGFIQTDNGQTYYFNMNDSEPVDELNNVEFELQGERAINVKKIC